MAVRDRSTRINYTNELNTDGIATQTELDSTIQNHIQTYHQGTSQGIDGFYYDTVRNAWLSNQTFLVNYFETNTNSTNRYLYSFGTLRCNYTPFSLYDSTEYVIVGLDFMNDKTVNGNIIDIRNGSTSATIYDINISNSKTLKLNNLNIVLPGTTTITTFINNISLSRPLLTLAIKKKVII